jgi:hypothetical protein
MRSNLVVCLLLALGVAAARCDGADKLIAPDDNLLASAGYVMDATAVKQLAERDWLFKGSSIANWFGNVGRSPYFVGWWNTAPEGSEHWAAPFPLRPAPQNSASLAEDRRFLVLADEDFHLLLVYPVEPAAGEYVRGMSEREFREHVTHLRTLYGTVREFLTAVTNADWPVVSSVLCAPIRKTMEASADPDSYLARIGVPRIQSLCSRTFDVTTLTDKKAEVMVEGYDGRRARIGSGVRVRLMLTLTRTRQMMGPMGWEIAQVKMIEERPWHSQGRPSQARAPAGRPSQPPRGGR